MCHHTIAIEHLLNATNAVDLARVELVQSTSQLDVQLQDLVTQIIAVAKQVDANIDQRIA